MSDDDPNREIAVLAVEVRLSRDELARRFDEQRDEFRALRKEMTTNYVTQNQHASDMARLTDRVVNVESDLVDVRTVNAAQLVELHGHIDRKFDQLTESRRFTIGQGIVVAGIIAAVVVDVVVRVTS